MTRRGMGGLIASAVLIATQAACADQSTATTEGTDVADPVEGPSIDEAATTLRREVDALGDRVGTRREVRNDETVPCELPGGDGSPVAQQYITAVRTQGDPTAQVTDTVLPAMDEAGWVLDTGPGEGSWTFTRDGYVVSVRLFPAQDRASVGGSSPCVQP